MLAVLVTIVAYRGQEQLAELNLKKGDLKQVIHLMMDQNNIATNLNWHENQSEEKRTILQAKFNELQKKLDDIAKNQSELYRIAMEMRVSQFIGIDSVNFLLAPMSLLTLLLCMAMGALGSAMNMTQEFLRSEEDKAFRWYFLRPFLGIMLAVATFILFKSGQVVLTVTPGANGAATDASLNPYVVGFVAIISGLLSEQAYHRISDAGAQLLAAKDAGVSRWLRPSVAATAREKANRPGGELRRFISTDPETIEGWLNGREQIGPAEQGVVAAWLDMPRWEAFTDQRPNAGPGDGKTSDAKLRTDDAAANANQTGETPPTAGSDHAAPAGTAEAENLEHRA
jgi:hypothetical protein